MPTELPKNYDPSRIEDRWYAAWLKDHCFTADPARAFNGQGLSAAQKSAERARGLKEAYSIVIPPPNVTGILHMGHVLNNTIQDILARRKRMQGFEVLWLPGIDHAGIATQAVVERQLRKELKQNRHQLGREEFLKHVWNWKDKHGGIILQQLKKLGCSCDWSRTVFTMDGLDPREPQPRINYSKWVTQVFVDLHRKGLIYRGRRMVNWCVVSQTALSDEEVIMKETKGNLWYFRYPAADDPRKGLVVATTRPETMLGDTAVAVNPHEPRYKNWIGKTLKLPLVGRLIPVIADEAVDPKFGTGCVKVTPAHDPADFEMGLRHNLPQLQVIGFNGRMTPAAGEEYDGLDRYECREKVVADLSELGLVEKIENYTHNVGYSERADVPAEPMLSEQWFLKYPAVQQALDAVLRKQIVFRPERWMKVYEHWIGNLKDWCISRQLWWGHRIPVWTRPRMKDGKPSDPELYVGIDPPTGPGWIQDPDVLDTWFSSWLWPFATMIPDPHASTTGSATPQSAPSSHMAAAAGLSGSPEIARFYPTTDLVTAPEILFFWVARMIMAGFEFRGQPPFGNVYFTGIVRDKQGRKMSKSLGNSPDPLDLIARYGADGLRFGVMRCAPLGLDVRFDEQQVELGRNFCTKLWNASRLRLSHASSVEAVSSLDGIAAGELSLDDHAILFRMDEAVREIEQAFADYEFNQIAARLYELFWTHFCDWYLEAAKTALYGADARRKTVTLAVMDHVLNVILRLFHPFMPFITEELWQALGFAGGADGRAGSIQFASWPVPFNEEEKKHLGLSSEKLRLAEQKYEAVTAARNLRASYRIPTSRKIPFAITPQGAWATDLREVESLKTLLNAESLEFVSTAPPGSAAALTALGTIHLPLAGLVDTAAEHKRLTAQIEKLEKELATVREKLADEGFTSRAPTEAVAKHRARADQLQADIEKIRGQMAAL